MTDRELVTTSKFLSMILRHKPEKAGISLDANGWANLDDIIRGLNKHGRVHVDLDDIKRIVAISDKQRFVFNSTLTKIRANHGHTVKVDVELEEVTPPEILYHGTATKSLSGIMQEGIQPRERLHVHVSIDEKTAMNVGQRHGKAVLLTIEAARMHADGLKFYRSANGIWLTDYVPVKYIRQSDEMYIPLYLKNKYLFVTIEGKQWLLDTGSPVSFGSLRSITICSEQFTVESNYLNTTVDSLIQAVGIPFAGVLGVDILNSFDLIFNLADNILTASTNELPCKGKYIDLDKTFLNTSVQGTIGNTILKNHTIGYFPRRRKMVLAKGR